MASPSSSASGSARIEGWRYERKPLTPCWRPFVYIRRILFGCPQYPIAIALRRIVGQRGMRWQPGTRRLTAGLSAALAFGRLLRSAHKTTKVIIEYDHVADQTHGSVTRPVGRFGLQ